MLITHAGGALSGVKMLRRSDPAAVSSADGSIVCSADVGIKDENNTTTADDQGRPRLMAGKCSHFILPANGGTIESSVGGSVLAGHFRFSFLFLLRRSMRVRPSVSALYRELRSAFIRS